MDHHEEYRRREAWLRDLKGGDQAVWTWGHSAMEAVTVARTTTAFIILEGRHADCKFRRADGRQAGASLGGTPRLEEPTIERLAEIRRRALVSHLAHHTNWGQVSLTKLERIAAVLAETEGAAHAEEA